MDISESSFKHFDGKKHTTPCDHWYDVLETIKTTTENKSEKIWKRVDIFYCKKCLDEKILIKELNDLEKPSWY